MPTLPQGEPLMITKTCVTCGKDFSVRPYRKDTAHCCSHGCYIKRIAGVFNQHAGHFSKGIVPWNKGRKCPILGNPKGPMSEETKRKVSVAKKGQAPWNKGKPWGEDFREKSSASHKRYYDRVGRATVKRAHHINDRLYARWREAVFARDAFRCHECGVSGGTLNAHHIKPWATYPELRYAVDNGATFCANCHRKQHRSVA